MSKNSRKHLSSRPASQGSLVRMTPPPVIPRRARSSYDDMYERLISRRMSPVETWLARENVGKVPGDPILVRCSGCQLPVRESLYSGTPRSGCSLTDWELKDLKNKPRSERPSWQKVTNCNGQSTLVHFQKMRAQRVLSGVKEWDLGAPPSEKELPREYWALFHQLDCDYFPATQAYSKLMEGGKEAV